MCGIAGYFGKLKIEEPFIQRTLHLMKNRGPDFMSYKAYQTDDFNLCLLHSRLSIIDLDERSNQPFTIGDYTIIFNGEIYNYLELKENLQKLNVKFHTTSDTEVLLQSYIEYGENCVSAFEGMWSFCIYDRKTKKLFLSRDRFGEKPLYYLKDKKGFYFGSEIKFLKSLSNSDLTINTQHLLRYLVNGYKSLYKTKENYFLEVHELPAGHNMVVNGDGKLSKYKYWTPSLLKVNMSIEEAIEGTRHHLIESMRLRLRADVPLAFCLSGGIDSASLVSIAAKKFNLNVATFSIIDHDERYNEYENVKATIDDLSCENTIVNLSQENMLLKLSDLIAYHDSPIATITYLVHSFLSELISKKGYKVAFSGTSADELFTGYYDHFNLHLYEMRNHKNFNKYLNDWKEHISPVVRNPNLQNPLLYIEQTDIRDHIYLNNDVFKSYLKVNFDENFSEETFIENSLLRNRMLNELLHEATPVILHEDDLNSMKYSIENRSPYLDSKLFSFAYSIPDEYLIMDGYGKYILREAVKGILNEQVRTDRQKRGFNASINSLINFNDKETREYLLDDSPIFELIDKSKVEEAINKSPMPNSFSKFVFNFINAKIFLERNDKSKQT